MSPDVFVSRILVLFLAVYANVRATLSGKKFEKLKLILWVYLKSKSRNENKTDSSHDFILMIKLILCS